jgi:hypothetical protein
MREKLATQPVEAPNYRIFMFADCYTSEIESDWSGGPGTATCRAGKNGAEWNAMTHLMAGRGDSSKKNL